jgi:hypothetical protein
MVLSIYRDIDSSASQRDRNRIYHGVNTTVLLHNGGFYNACTMKRCLHRTVDFKINALHNAHVSQLLPYYIL